MTDFFAWKREADWFDLCNARSAREKPRVVKGGLVHQDGRRTGEKIDKDVVEDVLSDVRYLLENVSQWVGGDEIRQAYVLQVLARVRLAECDLRYMNGGKKSRRKAGKE